MSIAPVAIVGAGIAGLACAHALRDSGRAVVLFDKGRGPGGRTSTRRSGEEAGRGWDHGAPAFAADTTAFRGAVAGWHAAELVAPWETEGETLWTGVPGMSALCRGLSVGLPLLQGMEVLGLRLGGDGWAVQGQDRHAGPFSAVVLTAPAPQSIALLGDRVPDIVAQLGRVDYEQCWTLLAETADAQAVALRRAADGGLPDCVEDIVCEDTKPGREPPAHGRRWTVHGDAEWSTGLAEADPAEPGHQLTAALEEVIDAPVRRGYAHFWRMARVSRAVKKQFLLDADAALGFAGDACAPAASGEGIGAAWTSGHGLGKAIADAC